jgi:hypothetical protein
METISDLLKKEPINDTFKMSALAILQASGDFKQVESINGIPTFELKREECCEQCGKTSAGCDCDEFPAI